MRIAAIPPLVVGILAGVMPVGQAHAGGFMLQEQSPLEIGRAFSGAAAGADTPSTIWYNPAGMTELPGLQLSAGAIALVVSSHQENTGTTRTAPGGSAATAVGGNSGGNPFAPVVPVPTSYASWQAGDSGLWFGLGISSPFGLKLRYNAGFFGRYDSIYSKLLTVNVQPSVAWRVSDALSVGAGIDVQYADATLTSALPQADPTADGKVKLAGDDVALGWNAGVLVKLKGGTRIGVHYRSDVKHELKGTNEISGLSGSLSTLNGSTPIRSPMTLPGAVTGSVSVPIDPATRFMLTARFYNWSVFDAIVVVLPNGSSIAKRYGYRDSWSLSAGVERRMSDRLTLRAGSMFDRTPTNPAFLSTRVPDGDRTWLSSGMSFKVTDQLTLNASYAHVFIAGQIMTRTDNFYGGPLLTSVTTRSRQSGNVDMIATSLTARF